MAESLGRAFSRKEDKLPNSEESPAQQQFDFHQWYYWSVWWQQFLYWQSYFSQPAYYSQYPFGYSGTNGFSPLWANYPLNHNLTPQAPVFNGERTTANTNLNGVQQNSNIRVIYGESIEDSFGLVNITVSTIS